MRLWIDDIRPAPEGYIWCKSTDIAKSVILWYEMREIENIELIDIDHDAGDYAYDGGDYIKLLDWLEETGRNYPIRIHSQNAIGRENMLRIAQRNNWTILD